MNVCITFHWNQSLIQFFALAISPLQTKRKEKMKIKIEHAGVLLLFIIGVSCLRSIFWGLRVNNVMLHATMSAIGARGMNNN